MRGLRLLDLSSSAAALTTAALAVTGVGLFFWKAWGASAESLIYNVPIAAPFVVFFLDRLFPDRAPRSTLVIDALVVGLALLRVVIPPLPFASGHTLFASYAALAARRWPLRLLAAAVLAQVIYMKLFVTGGAGSMLAGLAAGAGFAALQRRPARGGPTSGRPAAPPSS